MYAIYKYCAIASFLITVISFLLSMRNNLVMEALTRSIVVFILCFGIFLIFIFVLNVLMKPIESKHVQKIDLHTPEENPSFEPWQPEKMKDKQK